MILSDNHIHTLFSSDCDATMENIIMQAKKLGFSSICFTDHMDYNFPEKKYGMNFNFDVKKYFEKINELKSKYTDITLRTGIELGLKSDVLEKNVSLTKNTPFDFVIGSTHLVDDIDPYYPEYWESHGETDGIKYYYEYTLNNINLPFDYDVYGHIDYVIRYCPTVKRAIELNEVNNAYYLKSIKENGNILKEIFSTLVEKGKGIEINTGGFKYKLGHPNPHENLISLYRELGGKIITVGSDAHEISYLGYDFNKIPDILKKCGFSYYNEFWGRKCRKVEL